MRARWAIVGGALVVALAGCASPVDASGPGAAENHPKHGVTSQIDAIDAYAMCRGLLTSTLPYDQGVVGGIESFPTAQVDEVDGTFEVTIDGPISGGAGIESGKAFCVLTGELGDPRLLYHSLAGGSGNTGRDGWAAVRDATLAEYPHRAVDADREHDKNDAVSDLTAWSICRVLRLARQHDDFIAGWTDFNSAQLTRDVEGVQIYDVYPAGTADTGPTDMTSFCVVGGTMDEPYPALYFDRAAETPPDAREYYVRNLSEQVKASLG